ncbi:flavin reductase family protein [Streptomyces sp. NPDC048305]|uniref:flavin reductase family protein n=1 Tax=Streptomyces sp. NPDC048305 TaxID=3365532 RepID=UPI003724281B
MTESTAPPASTLPPSEEVTPDGFRSMMSAFPTGVSVVTGLDGAGVPRGMTCSSVCSVSLDPPTLLVCLRAGSPTLAAVREHGRFAVNLLHQDARATAELFASGDPRRFDLTPWVQDPCAAGPHLVRDAHTVADCTVALTQQVGDHVTVFGTTRRIVRHGAEAPLLYGMREFRRWTSV